jgi:hypothetical protein
MVQKWIDAFNKADIEMIAGLYADMPLITGSQQTWGEKTLLIKCLQTNLRQQR